MGQAWASPMAQTVKNRPAMLETWVPSLGWEDPLEEGLATRSSILGLPGGSDGKESACNAGDPGSTLGSGRFPGGGGHGNPLKYSCPENPMDRSLAGLPTWGHQRV